MRNLGLFVKTGGYLLDVALGAGDRPRLDRRARASCPAGHAITPTGGHLDPTMFQRLGARHHAAQRSRRASPTACAEVRKAVRYQIKYGAKLIKVSASGGVMSHSGPAGAQQYSDEELAAIADEAHRAGVQGRRARARRRRHPARASAAGIDCIEHGLLASDETIQMMVEHGTFLVSTTYLTDGLDVSNAAPELQAKAAEVFPQAQGDARARRSRRA